MQIIKREYLSQVPATVKEKLGHRDYSLWKTPASNAKEGPSGSLAVLKYLSTRIVDNSDGTVDKFQNCHVSFNTSASCLANGHGT